MITIRVWMLLLGLLVAPLGIWGSTEGFVEALGLADSGISITAVPDGLELREDVGRSDGKSLGITTAGEDVSAQIYLEFPAAGLFTYWTRVDSNDAPGTWVRWFLEVKEGQLSTWIYRYARGNVGATKVEWYIDDAHFQEGWGIKDSSSGGFLESEQIPVSGGDEYGFIVRAIPYEGNRFLDWLSASSEAYAHLWPREFQEELVFKSRDLYHSFSANFGEERSIVGGTIAVNVRETYEFGPETDGVVSEVRADKVRFFPSGPGVFRFRTNAGVSISNEGSREGDLSMIVEELDEGETYRDVEVAIPEWVDRLVLSVWDRGETTLSELRHIAGAEHYPIPVEVIGEGSIDRKWSVNEDGEGVRTLTASPDENWEFVRWEGDVFSSDSELQVTEDFDGELIARFALENIELGGLRWYLSPSRMTSETRTSDRFELGALPADVYGQDVKIATEVKGPGRLEFEVEGHGSFEFMFDGAEIEGSKPFREGGVYSVEVPVGTHWLYGKLNTYTSNGIDPLFWIENVTYEEVRYVVTPGAWGAGSVEIEPDGSGLAFGQKLDATAVPDPGSVFLGWAFLGEGQDFEFVALDENEAPLDKSFYVTQDSDLRAIFGTSVEDGFFKGLAVSSADLSVQEVGDAESGRAFVCDGMGDGDWMKLFTAEDRKPAEMVLRWKGELSSEEGTLKILAGMSDGTVVEGLIGDSWEKGFVTAPDGEVVDWVAISLAGAEGKAYLEISDMRYVVAFEPATGATVSIEPSKDLYSHGERITIGVTVDPQYEFWGWGGELAGQPAQFEHVVENTIRGKSPAGAPSNFNGVRILEGEEEFWRLAKGQGTENSVSIQRIEDGFGLGSLSVEVEGPGVLSFVNYCTDIDVYVDGVELSFHLLEGRSAKDGNVRVQVPVSEGKHIVDVLIVGRTACYDAGKRVEGTKCYFDEVMFRSGYLLRSKTEQESSALGLGDDVWVAGEVVTLKAGSEDEAFARWSSPFENEAAEFDVQVAGHARVFPHFDDEEIVSDKLVRFEGMYLINANLRELLSFDGGFGANVASRLRFDYSLVRQVSFMPRVFSEDDEAFVMVRVLSDSGLVLEEIVNVGEERMISFATDPEFGEFVVEFLPWSDESQVTCVLACFSPEGQEETDVSIGYGVTIEPNKRDFEFGEKAVVTASETLGEGAKVMVTRKKGIELQGDPIGEELTFVAKGAGYSQFVGLHDVGGGAYLAADRDIEVEIQSDVVRSGDSAFAVDLSKSKSILIPTTGASVLKFWVYLDFGERITINSYPDGRYTNSQTLKPYLSLVGEGGWHQVSYTASDFDEGIKILAGPGRLEFDDFEFSNGYGFDYTVGPNYAVSESPQRTAYRIGELVTLEISSGGENEVGWFSDSGSVIRRRAGMSQVEPWFGEELAYGWEGFRVRGVPVLADYSGGGQLALKGDGKLSTQVLATLEGPSLMEFRYSPHHSSALSADLSVKVNGEEVRRFTDLATRTVLLQLEEGPNEVVLEFVGDAERYSDWIASLSDLGVHPGYSVVFDGAFSNGEIQALPRSRGLEEGDELLVVFNPSSGYSYYSSDGTLHKGFEKMEVDGHILLKGGFYRAHYGEESPFLQNGQGGEWFANLEGPGVVKVTDSQPGQLRAFWNGEPLFNRNGDDRSAVYLIPEEEGEFFLEQTYNASHYMPVEFHPGYGIVNTVEFGPVELEPRLESYPAGMEVSVTHESGSFGTAEESFTLVMDRHHVLANPVVRELGFKGRTYRTPKFGWVVKETEDPYDSDAGVFWAMAPLEDGKRSWLETTVSGPCELYFDFNAYTDSYDVEILVDGVRTFRGFSSDSKISIREGDHVVRIRGIGASRVILKELTVIGVEGEDTPKESEDDADGDGVPYWLEERWRTSDEDAENWFRIVEHGADKRLCLLFPNPGSVRETWLDYWAESDQTSEPLFLTAPLWRFETIAYDGAGPIDSILLPIDQLRDGAKLFRIRIDSW
ncbi:InlB B-repeat-containing protein [Pelagicoccus mobilis]|uniref:Bacterial repeat domain-containing protein n=1 Tax=Pelagicoccus mobilis TaxID=415221 RepID=A0A934S052_9BACT|nr:hypothetical protein [Pelagicoccus mobilis]MBK1879932.1 hypothetical protein [Pelagicoccus mobilis]